MATVLQLAYLGNPALRTRAGAVADPRDPAIHSLVANMLATNEAAAGLGLAAPQVSEPLRLIVVGSRPTRFYPDAAVMPLTPMVNPELLWKSEEREYGWETCLSIPGVAGGRVPRSRVVRVRFASLDGESTAQELSGLAARVLQHELDHLDGFVYLDRLESTKDIISANELPRFVP
jgi:peptide deformylase